MATELLPETLINQTYRLREKLGEGGMSVVYKVDDLVRKKEVALKFLKSGMTSGFLEDVIRFKREVEIVSRFDHPSILKLYGAGEYQNRPYLVSELVTGESLAHLLKRGLELSARDAVDIVKQLAEALAYMHSQGVIHRDLKPDNVLLQKDRQRYTVKLIDFGVSFILELGEIKDEEEIVGTFGYMSPEGTGIIGSRVDERSDLYSLGVIFYRLLTGELPFKSREVNKILHEQVATLPAAPTKIKSSIPRVLEEIILKLVQKDPELRYQTARGLAYDLERFLKDGSDFLIAEKDQKIKLSYQTRLIGREEEVRRIKSLYEKTKQSGKGAVCLLEGEAGVGKNKILDEIRGWAYQDGLFLVGGRCLDQPNKPPYQPFKDALNEYLKKMEKKSHAERDRESARLKELLGDLSEVILRLNPRLSALLGESKELVPLDPERENRRFLTVAANFLLHLTEEPLVLFLDDLQWADEGTLKLLEEISGQIRTAKVLVVATNRPHENPGHVLNRLKQEKKLEAVALDPFDHPKLNRLVAGILGEKEESAHDLTNYILEKTKGNPFFSITALRELVEEKAIVWREGVWEADWEKIRQIPVSSNMIDLILRRVKDLSPAQANFLSLCSVVGREFEIDFLYRLTPLKNTDVIKLIDDAIDLQLMDESKERGKVLFAHDKIRDAFFQKLEPKERQAHHLKIAEALEAANRGNLEPFLFALTHHYSEGGNKDKSLEYAVPAARKAKENCSNEEAIRHYELALRLLEEKGHRRAVESPVLKEELAEVYITHGESEKAIALLEEILPLKTSLIEKAKVCRKIGSASFKKADLEDTEKMLVRALDCLGVKVPRTNGEVATAILKELFIHFCHVLLPQLFAHRKGAPVKEESREIVATGLSVFWLCAESNITKLVWISFKMLNVARAEIGESKELGMGLGCYASVMMSIPFFGVATRAFEKALYLAKKFNDDNGTGQYFQWFAFSEVFQGHYKKSIDYFSASLDVYQKIGDFWESALDYNGLGYVHRFMADYPQLIAYNTQYLELAQKIHEDFAIATAQGLLTEAYARSEDYEKADELTSKSLALTLAKKLWFTRCYCLSFAGYYELERGMLKESLTHLEEAKALYEKNSFFKDMTVQLYPYLADALIEAYKADELLLDEKEKKDRTAKIKKACVESLRRTKRWANHHGLSQRAMAKYLAIRGRTQEAEKYFMKSISHHRRLGRRFEEAKSCVEYGHFLESRHRNAEAERFWKEAHSRLVVVGAHDYLRKTSKFLGYTKDKTESLPSNSTPKERFNVERRLSLVLETGRHLSAILDLDELLETIMDSAMELVGAERGLLFLYPEEEGQELELKVFRNVLKEEMEKTSSQISKGIIKKVENEKVPVIVDDASFDDTLKTDASVVRQDLKSILCVPILVRGRLLGVLYLDNSLMSGVFNKSHLEILDLIGSQAGVSIENARLYKRAITDGMTKLYNFVFFEDYLINLVHSAERYGKKVSLLIVDIDHFKGFNDRYGHPVGDIVIKETARLLRMTVRKADLVARYGGDEFVVVLPEADLAAAKLVAEKLCQIVRENKLLSEGRELNVTLSIGAAEFHPHETARELIQAADQALYKAKARGRNQAATLSD